MSSVHHFGFVIEQSMGHVTHTQNLQQTIDQDASVEATWLPVPLDASDRWQPISNLSLRLSLRSRDLVRSVREQKPIDRLLFHTQLLTLFSLKLMQQIPTVISLDATPENFNTIAAAYDAKPPQGLLAQLKSRWYKLILNNAAGLITFSEWVKQSLEQDYQVDHTKIHVIPPGVDVNRWVPVARSNHTNPVRLLFVGRDFKRKGGAVLLDAYRQGLAGLCELDIVTTDPTLQSEGAIRVHQGLTPNSSALQQLFAQADIFVFPTFGDATAFVVLEAMASGLPVIATAVGGLSEEVEDGVTGLLVPPGNPSAIVAAVRSLIADPVRRAAMGAAGRARVESYFNAESNAKSVLEVMKQCAIV